MPSSGYGEKCGLPSTACQCGKGWCSKWFYNPNGPAQIFRFPDVLKIEPQAVKVVNEVMFQSDQALQTFMNKKGGFEQVAALFEGVLSVYKAGEYTVCTSSDDGSHLYIDEKQVVDSGGLHGTRKKCEDVKLAAGDHKTKVTFFENGGGASISVLYSGPDTDGKEVPIPSAWHEEGTCGVNPDAPPEVCDCTADKKKLSAGTCNDYRTEGYKRCKEKPGCQMHTACGCIPKHCSCGDKACHAGGVQAISAQNSSEKVEHEEEGPLQGVTPSGKDCECPIPPKPKDRKGPRGFCSKWYYNPLGGAAISNMPDVSKLIPQKAVVLQKMEFVRDSDFASVVGLEHFDRVAITYSGILEILKEGEYDVCVTSDDGAHVYIDAEKIASRPGLHPPQKGCGSRKLTAGDHRISGTFFEDGGGAYLKVTYAGPDTGGAIELLPSAGFDGECGLPKATCSCGLGWCSRWFFNPNGHRPLFTYPRVDDLSPQEVVPVKEIAFPSDNALTNLLGKQGIFDQVAGEFSGLLSVHQSGEYTVCTSSDDGSHMYVDGEEAVDNGGLHGTRQKCGKIALSTGDHRVRITFFENGGGASITVLYSGPDTDGKEVYMPSAWHDEDTCGENPNAPPEVCDCTGDKLEPAATCEKHKVSGYQRCNEKPGCQMHTACGCIPAHCACGDKKCHAGGALVAVTSGEEDKNTPKKGVTPSGKECTCPVEPKVKEREGPIGFCSKWYYNPLGGAAISTMPDIKEIMPQKALIVPKMDFLRDADFAELVGLQHFDRVALTFNGILEVLKQGDYTVCVTSDDGAHIYMDYEEIASKPGLHPPQKGCGKRTLSHGDHHVSGTFFENGGGAYIKVTYRGPDTNNAEVLLPSVGFSGGCGVPLAKCDCGEGWCSRWFFDPNGPSEIFSFPDVSHMHPQKAVTVQEIAFESDASFIKLLGKQGSFDHVAGEFTGLLVVKDGGEYTGELHDLSLALLVYLCRRIGEGDRLCAGG